MLQIKRNFSEEPECYPLQICFVDRMPSFLLKLAEKFGLPVIWPEQNNNDVIANPSSRTIYVFPEFENHKMFDPVQNTPNTWILGMTALEEMSEDPSLELRPKPTYCHFMYGFVFYINCPEDYPLMRRMVKLIKWMGGRFQTEPMFQTTHMITTTTLAKGYTYCYTFNIPVLSPAWVECCWKHRHTTRFNVTDIMDKYRVQAFAGLKIAFKGFNAEELRLLENQAKCYGAEVDTPEDPLCTHLVLSGDIARHVNFNDIPLHISYVVNESWYTLSVEQNQRVNEDQHLCFSTKEIRKSLWAVMDADEISEKRKVRCSTFKASLANEDKLLSDTAKKETQDVKRKYAFEDLHLKEKNYLRCLKQLLNIKKLATEDKQSGGAILKQAEAKIMFGNLDKIVSIHQDLNDCFGNILLNWTNDVITVHRIVDLKNELLKQYVTYTNNYKVSKQLMEECSVKNKRFETLLENSVIRKEHPKDILIRPVQRLCSMVLQLREINKATREDNPDKAMLNEAILVVEDLLKKVNNSEEKVEKLRIVFDIHRLIKDCPPDLVSSHREFIVQFSAKEVVVESHQNLGMKIMFFLFRDILEITKIRNKSQAVLKNENTLTTQKEKLPYKHVATIPLSMIINVIEFEGKDEDDQKMFGFTVNDAKKEETTSIYCFQCSEENPCDIDEILKLIAEQIAQRDITKSPDDFILSSVPINRVNIVPVSSPSPQHKVFNKVRHLIKKNDHKVLKTQNVLRKSLSCGDLIDTPH